MAGRSGWSTGLEWATSSGFGGMGISQAFRDSACREGFIRVSWVWRSQGDGQRVGSTGSGDDRVPGGQFL